MKLTKSKLKQIIKEELEFVLNERVGDGDAFTSPPDNPKGSPPQTTKGGLEDLWDTIKSRVKEMDDDMDRVAAEEYEKVKTIDKFLDDAKNFVDGWWGGK